MNKSLKENLANSRLEGLLGQRGADKRALTVEDIEGIIAERIQDALKHRLMMAGDIFFCASTSREGALLANGAQVSRMKHHTLFQSIGTANGAGDGTTTFNLPNIPDLSGMKAFIKM